MAYDPPFSQNNLKGILNMLAESKKEIETSAKVIQAMASGMSKTDAQLLHNRGVESMLAFSDNYGTNEALLLGNLDDALYLSAEEERNRE